MQERAHVTRLILVWHWCGLEWHGRVSFTIMPSRVLFVPKSRNNRLRFDVVEHTIASSFD